MLGTPQEMIDAERDWSKLEGEKPKEEPGCGGAILWVIFVVSLFYFLS